MTTQHGTRQKTEHRSYAEPDEVREFPHGRIEIVQGDVLVGNIELRLSGAERNTSEDAAAEAHIRGHAVATRRLQNEHGLSELHALKLAAALDGAAL